MFPTCPPINLPLPFHRIADMPFPRTPEETLFQELEIHKAAAREADLLMAGQLKAAHEDKDFVEQAIADARAALPYPMKRTSKDVTVLFQGGTKIAIRTPYLRRNHKKRRGPKRMKRGKKGTGVYPVLEALGIQDRVSPATRSEIALLTVQVGSYQEAVDMLERRGFNCDPSTLTRIAATTAQTHLALRSAANGSQLLLLDLTIAGASGPNSPEALLTLIHAQVLFMMVLAQTVRPGIVCVHGGIPGIMDASHDLSYSSPLQPMINCALARLNRWVTGFPSAQSGGSTSLADDLDAAVRESEISRSRMRKYGVHMVSHALGAMGNLTFFSLEKFIEDCRREAQAQKAAQAAGKNLPVFPLDLPEDADAIGAIREMALRGNPRNTDHNLRHVNDMAAWERRIPHAEEKETAADLLRRQPVDLRLGPVVEPNPSVRVGDDDALVQFRQDRQEVDPAEIEIVLRFIHRVFRLPVFSLSMPIPRQNKRFHSQSPPFKPS